MKFRAEYKVKADDKIEQGGFVGAKFVDLKEGCVVIVFEDNSSLLIPVANIVGEMLVEVDRA